MMLGHQAGHIQVWNELAVKGKLDLAFPVRGEWHIQDGFPNIDVFGGDLLHQFFSAAVGLLRIIRNGLAEIGQAAVGRFDGLDKVAYG